MALTHIFPILPFTPTALPAANLSTAIAVLGSAGLIFARSGFTGTQAFPGCWAGDNEPNFGIEDGLPSVIVAGLASAMSGFSIWVTMSAAI